MEWIDLWHGIEYLFVEVLFIPLDWLRNLQFDTWWGANMFNWVFLLIGAAAFMYWLKQLNGFREEEKENASHSAH